jgi:hypothetical protein
MQNLLKGLLALALASTLGACATVTRGTSTRFTIESSPPGAHASTSSGFVCESTPCTIRMPRKDKFVVTVTKPGYKTATLQVESKLAGNGGVAFVGNALIGGVIGAGVDVATGAMDDLTPNPAHIILEADEPPVPAAPVTPTAPAAAVAPAKAVDVPTAAPAPAPTPAVAAKS